jgi:hypothetical protein
MPEQIGQIIRLDEGFVLQMYGRDYVARDVKELGKQVSRLAARRPKVRPTVPQESNVVQLPERNMVDFPPVAEVAPSWEALRAIDDRNLEKLIGARLTGQITGEDLMRGAATTIKTYTLQEVADYVLDAEKQFLQQAPATKDTVLGTKCSCPACPQNTSYPNPAGQCVTCWSGDHMHPGGPGDSQRHIPGVQHQADLIGRSPEVSAGVGDSVRTEDAPEDDPVLVSGDAIPEWEEPDADDATTEVVSRQ